MIQYKSVTSLVVTPVFISLVIILSLTFFSVSKTFSVLNQFSELENTVVQVERDFADVLSDFKTQVQEWKNVLLRGHKRDDRDKYWQRFQDNERSIQMRLNDLRGSDTLTLEAKQKIDAFLSAHRNMATKYREGYQAFIDANYDPKVGDSYVRGIDREPAKILGELAELTATEARASIAELKASTRQTLWWLVIAFLTLTVATVYYVVKRLRSHIIKPVKSMAKQLDAMAKADYSVELTYESEHELGVLANAARVLQQKLRNTVSDLNGADDHISAAANTLHDISRVLDDSAQQQTSASASLEQSTNQLSDCAAELRKISEVVSEVSALSNQKMGRCAATFEAANDGFVQLADNVAKSGQVVEALQSRSSNIHGVVNVINEIADQTNLLALNAAIEAARAGEHGRGFAVVADEVRALAAKTQQSTKEINEILGAFEQEAKGAVVAMQTGKELSMSNAKEAQEALNELNSVVAEVAHTAEEAAKLTQVSERQSAVSIDVAAISTQIGSLSQQSRELAARQDVSEHMATATSAFKRIVRSLTRN
ncbi:methyl-accepting chemotaxis protein [Alteromonas sp. ASW11-36]|uniref:Methyl-accepting chemotaxis protein n=1 Tax=Alteromonas arenosi TaxID=3055817 RepID=A0ABT7SVY4_9ALTE|nr:methyl-accepting chemotaxis protein [Alteromonas sp. ASW11-36]MDM7859712.1 methyl-accepting chemotaxis protein [Alteromonas sp. ASW11-36]